MSFSRRSFFRSLRGIGSSYFSDSSKGRKLSRTIHGRRLHLEPLEDRSLLSVGVGGMVWHDANLDGLQNAEELGIAGVSVEIYSSTDDIVGNADDVSFDSSITDENGAYTFDGLTPGNNYYVIFTAPAGKAFTTENVGTDDTIDSDVDSTGTIAMFTAVADTTLENLDAGLVASEGDSASICGLESSLLIEAENRVDMVFDSLRNMVYITTTDGYVLRYDLANREYLVPYELGGGLKGIDISLDQHTIVVASDEVDADNDTNCVHVIDLRTDDISTINIDRASHEAGTYSVAFIDNDTVLVSSDCYGTGHVPLRKVNLSTGYTEIVLNIIDQRSILSASADYSIVAYREYGASFGYYSTSDETTRDTSSYAAGYGIIWEIVVNNDGTQLGVITSDGVYIFDTDLNISAIFGLDTFQGTRSPLSAIYSPVSDRIYISWATRDGTGSQINTYDTNTWSKLDTVDSTTSYVTSFYHTYKYGLLKISKDGSLLLASVEGGVQVYNVSVSELTLYAPEYTNSSTPAISMALTCSDDNVSDGAFVYLDVDLNYDGDFLDEGEAGYATASLADGEAVFDSIAALSEGTYNLRSRMYDDAGNEELSQTVEMVVDFTAPTVTLVLPDITNDRTPSGTATVEDNASGVAPGETVYLDVDLNNDGDFDDEDETGYATYTSYLGIAEFTIRGVLAGGTYRVQARASDQAGNEGTSDSFVLVVDLTPPVVEIAAPLLTTDSTPEVTVTADVIDGKVVFLCVDLNNDGDFRDNGEGGYTSATIVGGAITFEITPGLADGTYNLKALAVDDVGNKGYSDIITIVVDTVPPTVELTVPAFSNETMPEITVAADLADGESVYVDVDLNNDGDYDDEGELAYIEIVLAEGTATFELTPALAEGDYNLRARAYDDAGNGGSDEATMVVDVKSPSITISAPSASLSHGYAITYTITYDDLHLGEINLTAEDISLTRGTTGTADGTVSVSQLSETTYLVTIDDITGEGSFCIGIAPGTASDLAGNLAALVFGSESFLVEYAGPIDIYLSNQDVLGNLPAGTLVGVFSSDGTDRTSFTYSLVEGEGDDDNAGFTIDGDQLLTAEMFDYSTKNTYTIRVRTTDAQNNLFEETFTITVVDTFSANGLAWLDVDADGAQDAEETALSGITVEIYSSADQAIGNSDDTLLATTTTDAEGLYAFDNFPADQNYYVAFRSPVGYEFTLQDAGDDLLDSDVDNAGMTALFSIEDGQDEITLDAGLVGASPEFGWALNGGITDERASAEAVVIDDDGNTYVTGYFAGTVDFDHGPGEFNLASAGNYDAFVAKYSADGALVWAKSFGGESADKGFDLARDGLGNLYVTGYFYDTADFDPGEGIFNLTSAGDNDAFTMKLDADGNLVWATAIGDEHADLTRSIAIAADGSILTTGYTTDKYLLFVIEPNTDIVIHKQDADGNLIWTKTIGGDDSDEGAGITAADDGSVFITGYFSGTTDFDPGEDVYNITVGPNYYGYGDDDPDNYDNIQDSFVLKLDADGNFVWATGLDGNEVDVLNDIAISADGSLYAAGSASLEIIWWIPVTPGPAFPVQFFPVTVIGGPGGGYTCYGSISSDYPFLSDLYSPSSSSESRIISGTSSGSDGEQGLIFASLNAPVETNSIGMLELGSLLVKLDADGNLLWSESYGSYGSEGAGVTVGADGNIYVAGNLRGGTNFNSDTGGFLRSCDDCGALISVWSAEGEFVKAYLADSSDSAIGHDVAVSAVGDVYMAGTFNGTTDFDPTANEYNLTNLGDADFFVCKFLAVEAPAAIALSSQSVAEGLEVGAMVGDFDTDGNQTGATFTYTLVEGQGDDNNASFLIEGNQLQTNQVFDCSVKDSYSIRVRSTDNFGQSVEKVITITIIDETAPTITIDAPDFTNDTTPSVTVTSTEGETVYLDVDLNNDGDYDDDGEAGYTTATLVDGSVTFNITPELADGTYNLRARAFDQNNNEGFSTVVATTVDTVAPYMFATPPVWLTSNQTFFFAYVKDVVDGNNVDLPDGMLAFLDVDVNDDGDFDDPGENGALSVTTVNGYVNFDMTPYIHDGKYDLRIRARVTDQAGNEGVLVLSATVMAGSPDVALTAPAITNDSTPEVTVTVANVVQYPCGPVLLDVDLNNDGDFDDTGEMGYATATLTDGTATFDITPELADGTYSLRARVSDAAGNEGASEVATMTVDMTAPVVTIDGPAGGIAENNTITFTISYNDANFDANTLAIADIELITTGTATGTVWIGWGNGATRHITISGISGQGSLAIAVASDTAADLAGNTALAAGPSDPVTVGHRIDSVVVVEKDPLDQDGVLESNEELVITWAVRGLDDATNVELLIDGQPVQSVYGPYASQDGAYLYAGIFGPLAAGDHTYSISSLDAFSDTATTTGAFNVAAAAISGPTVSQVCVVEAALENGELESGEELVITWSATGDSNIVSRSLKIDGHAVAKTNGPYGTYYSGVFGPLAAGDHAYEITVIDANGADAILTGTFNVAAAPTVAGPTISNIVVAEAAWENGKVESDEKLVISWSATGKSDIVSRSLKIDGQAVQKMFGPYGSNYSGVFGPLAAGDHAYEITVIDVNGADAILTGTFNVAASSVLSPTIAGVCIVEAVAENGVLESEEELVITWSAVSGSAIVSRSLTIDGQAVQKTFGPYGMNYSSVFGPLAAGEHTYSITVTDANGAQATHTDTFNVIWPTVSYNSLITSRNGTSTGRAALLAAVIDEMSDILGHDKTADELANCLV